MLEPTTSPTGSKPAFSTHRYSLTDRSEVNSPRAFICSCSLACSARPSVLFGSYVDTDALQSGDGLAAEVDRHDRNTQTLRMRLVRTQYHRGAQHVHGNDEEVLGVAATLVLVVIDAVRQGRDDHLVRTGLDCLTVDLIHREPTGGVHALGDLDHLLVAPPGAHHLI